MANTRINVKINASQASRQIKSLAADTVTANGRINNSAEGITTTFDRLLISAKKMGSQLVENTKNMNGKDAIRSINEQIAAMERLNKIRREAALNKLGSERTSGAISESEHKNSSRAANNGFNKKQLEIELLKNILEQLRQGARNEIVSDSRGNDRIIQENRRAGLEGDNDALMRSNFQEVFSNEESPQENKGLISGRVGRVANDTIAGAAGNENEMFAAAALAGLIPVIGEGLANFYNKALNEAQEYQTSRGSVQSMSTETFKDDRFGQRFGVKMADYNSEFLEPATRATGNFSDGRKAGEDALLINKAMGVDKSTIFSGMENLRTSDNKSVMDSANAMQTTLERVGVVKSGDFTKLGEYLEINNRLLGSQLDSLDKISSDTNTRLITGLSSMGGSFENPRVAESVAGSIDSSLKNPSNDFIKAMQFDVLSRKNPNASVFEIMKMRSQGIQNKDFATGMIDSAIGAGGSESDIMLRATQMLGMQGKEEQVERLIKSRMGGKGIYSDLSKDENLRKELKGRAGEVTPELSRRTAEMNDSFASGGDKLSKSLDETLNKTFGTSIPQAVESVLGFTSAGITGVGEMVQGVKDMKESMDSVAKNVTGVVNWLTGNKEKEEGSVVKDPTGHEND